jgi:hypothetical protein
LNRFWKKMLPNEHGFFHQDGAKAITANNPMADLGNIIWGGGGGGLTTTHKTGADLKVITSAENAARPITIRRAAPETS